LAIEFCVFQVQYSTGGLVNVESCELAPRVLRGQSTFGSILQSISLALRLLNYNIRCFFLSHPLLLRLVFAFIRRVRPVAIVGNVVVVAKARDVREVLDRLADFTVAEDLGPRIPWGPFMVVIDWPEQHARERELLQSVVTPAADVDQIRDKAATICRDRILLVRRSGRIDVVKDLCEPVVIDIIENYFGIPSGGMSADEMAHVLGRIAGFIMVEPPVGSEPRTAALDSIARLTRLIVDRIQGKTPPPTTGGLPDLLTRLVALPGKGSPALPDHDWIRRYITGLAVFGGGTIICATTHAIDQLIRHPDDLLAAQTLAMDLDRDIIECKRLRTSDKPWQFVQQRIDTARENLLQIIYEALRFRPMLPILSRYVPRETIIAKDTPHARLVPAGATALAPPIAAMFDPEEFPNPWRFSRTRCLKKYVHLGDGPRLCFGKYVADVLMVEIFLALLLCDELKRAGDATGRIAYEGPAATSLVLTFRP
jgi:cytochrome P450